jgi:methyl-accepting chemotaxis protein
VEAAHGVLVALQARERSGELSREQAQQLARETVAGMRYGGNEYFWINDMHPRVVMHPIKPELDGQDVSGTKDPNGKALFVAFVETVRRDGAGFVEYQWPRPGSSQPVDKLSYVKGLSPGAGSSAPVSGSTTCARRSSAAWPGWRAWWRCRCWRPATCS